MIPCPDTGQRSSVNIRRDYGGACVTKFLGKLDQSGLAQKHRRNIYNLVNVSFELALANGLIFSNPVRSKDSSAAPDLDGGRKAGRVGRGICAWNGRQGSSPAHRCNDRPDLYLAQGTDDSTFAGGARRSAG